jgi:hypothetical protein
VTSISIAWLVAAFSLLLIVAWNTVAVLAISAIPWLGCTPLIQSCTTDVTSTAMKLILSVAVRGTLAKGVGARGGSVLAVIVASSHGPSTT